MDNQLSDISARVAKLENPDLTQEPEQVDNGDGWHFFKTPIQIVYSSPSATTSYADSGSSKYIPKTAKRAIAIAAVEDTTNGVGKSTLYARGGGVEREIAWIYEFNSGDIMSSASGDVFIPLSAGRFDWKFVMAAGGSGANVRIVIVGYME